MFLDYKTKGPLEFAIFKIWKVLNHRTVLSWYDSELSCDWLKMAKCDLELMDTK